MISKVKYCLHAYRRISLEKVRHQKIGFQHLHFTEQDSEDLYRNTQNLEIKNTRGVALCFTNNYTSFAFSKFPQYPLFCFSIAGSKSLRMFLIVESLDKCSYSQHKLNTLSTQRKFNTIIHIENSYPQHKLRNK